MMFAMTIAHKNEKNRSFLCHVYTNKMHTCHKNDIVLDFHYVDKLPKTSINNCAKDGRCSSLVSPSRLTSRVLGTKYG